jgi:hypothetical protein
MVHFEPTKNTNMSQPERASAFEGHPDLDSFWLKWNG